MGGGVAWKFAPRGGDSRNPICLGHVGWWPSAEFGAGIAAGDHIGGWGAPHSDQGRPFVCAFGTSSVICPLFAGVLFFLALASPGIVLWGFVAHAATPFVCAPFVHYV